MGLLNTELAVAHISFSGIQEYANSEVEESPILSRVQIEGSDALYQGASALAVMIPLGACCMVEMLNRMPQYVEPFMRLVGSTSTAILEGSWGSEFRVRDHLMTSSEDLAVFASISGSMAEAEVNGALPVVRDELGPVERETRLRLMMRKSSEIPWASYKFKMGSANPLTTIGAWSSTLEYWVREYPYEEVAQPAAAAMTMMSRGWEALGSPPGMPPEPLALTKAMVTAIAIDNDPLARADWPPSEDNEDEFIHES